MNSRPPRKATPARMPVVPMHRGPQAGTATYSGQGGFHAPNAALLIDFDNVTTGIRSDLGNELRNLLSSDIIKGKVAVQRAYADWRRYPQHMVPLAEASIDTIQATAYGSAKKNATDIRLAVDAIELVFTRPEIGTYILLSGDSDFSSLVLKLKEYGKYVIGVGIRESSSDLLVMNCDEYYSYNALAGLVKTGDEEAPKFDPWELVTEAVTRMKRNGDVMRSDRLKQVMQEIDPDFDEKELGHPKFSRFCLEAAQRGLLSVTKLENGQLEVDLPREKAAAAPPPPRRPAAEGHAPAPARDVAEGDGAGEDRGRSRRGRGRGRGRDRGDRPPRHDAEPRIDTATTAEMEIPSGVPRADAGESRGSREAPPPREERPPREPRPPREAVGQGSPAAAPTAMGGDIGVSGERLTKNEAFDLIRRAVEALTTSPDEVVRASDVRIRARQLLGRDSQTLAEQFFGRILRDAHDADVIDLRRRGDDFEVARAAEAAPVAEQLSRAAAAAPPPSAGAPPAPRGMGPRGGGPGRGGRGSFGARVGAPPPELLSIGVVDIPSSSPAGDAIPTSFVETARTEPVDVEPVEVEAVEAETPAEPARRSAAKRGTRAKPATGRAAKKGAAKSAAAAAPVDAKPRRPRAKKTARTAEE